MNTEVIKKIIDMPSILRLLALYSLMGFVGILLLSACSGGFMGLGGKKSPDEFEVVSHSPLVVPPDYSLRVPRPGAERPNKRAIRDIAADELFGDEKNMERNSSLGEQAILKGANALDPNPIIREVIEREFKVEKSEEDGFLDSILFWKKDSIDDQLIDAEAEAGRLENNINQGKSPNEGDPKVLGEREKSLLEDLF